jgi:hypothetical protein
LQEIFTLNWRMNQGLAKMTWEIFQIIFEDFK